MLISFLKLFSPATITLCNCDIDVLPSQKYFITVGSTVVQQHRPMLCPLFCLSGQPAQNPTGGVCWSYTENNLELLISINDIDNDNTIRHQPAENDVPEKKKKDLVIVSIV